MQENNRRDTNHKRPMDAPAAHHPPPPRARLADHITPSPPLANIHLHGRVGRNVLVPPRHVRRVSGVGRAGHGLHQGHIRLSRQSAAQSASPSSRRTSGGQQRYKGGARVRKTGSTSSRHPRYGMNTERVPPQAKKIPTHEKHAPKHHMRLPASTAGRGGGAGHRERTHPRSLQMPGSRSAC